MQKNHEKSDPKAAFSLLYTHEECAHICGKEKSTNKDLSDSEDRFKKEKKHSTNKKISISRKIIVPLCCRMPIDNRQNSKKN
jgi:hypothetical protein